MINDKAQLNKEMQKCPHFLFNEAQSKSISKVNWFFLLSNSVNPKISITPNLCSSKYTQSSIIRNGLSRNSCEFLGKIKKTTSGQVKFKEHILICQKSMQGTCQISKAREQVVF